MHKLIIEDASQEQLKSFINGALSMIKEANKTLYDDLETILYKEIYGEHFNAWLLEKALKNFQNEDGSYGGHWTVEQTTNVARQNGIKFVDYNEYDWNYVMNMIYSDYYGSVPNDLSIYLNMSKKFLEDKDAKKGKALCYYLAMKK